MDARILKLSGLSSSMSNFENKEAERKIQLGHVRGVVNYYLKTGVGKADQVNTVLIVSLTGGESGTGSGEGRDKLLRF
jgi:hypothetical protein